jgi:hypothetical protein
MTIEVQRATIDHEALLDIVEMLETDAWASWKVDAIAAIVIAAGYPLRACVPVAPDPEASP